MNQQLDISEMNEFLSWFNEEWRKGGGLINQMTASKILNISDSAVSQLVKNQKLDMTCHGKHKYLYLNQVLMYKAQRDESLSA